MRSFIVLLLVGLLATQMSMASQAAEQDIALFRVEIPKVEGQSFDQLLNRAMQIELIRLTGSLQILSNPERKVFTDNPKAWLNTYGYRPVIRDGVQIGEKIFFDFSAQRIYQQFQKSNLLVWPLEQRPKIFVVAGHSLAGSVTQLTEQNLPYRSDVHFKDFARNVALDIEIPQTNSDWILPETELRKKILAEMLKDMGAEYLLVIDMQQFATGNRHLTWQLYSSYLEKVAERTIKNKSASRNYLKQTFYDVLSVLSSSFRENIVGYGEFYLSITGIDQFKEFYKLESFLKAQRALFRKVTLTESSQNKIVFRLEYRGELDSVLENLHQNINLVVTSSDKLTGQVLAEWQ